ncbi:sensor histidine kinase [Polaribacter reichenbachii]|uniref:histidine kinase n=1 Tax=Polaribacter reichenbachii TaxID=996801 RepID=A0A1B8U6Y1_9FLAO|nr:HAMP domain-containing sensor histidine kinase [Polaribacter reichenbachii]APZ46300.1 sensor histidine kinase [Polaribacter reichenbachii]AUC20163.1 sensor histidine kinase [Polaribacter reichenbachii]OBY67578.1 histidine kinase [Polaribacter reichenbachii]
MNTQKHKWIFYFITTTIITTIAVQCYWNYKNYEENKQRVANEIQLSLDNAVEEYFSTLAKNDFLTIIKSNNNDKDVKVSVDNSFDSIIKKLKKSRTKTDQAKFTINSIQISSDENFSQEKIDSMMLDTKELITELNNKQDSIKLSQSNTDKIKSFTQFTDNKNGVHFDESGKKSSVKYYKGKAAADSLKLMTNLKPIFISFLDQSLDYHKIDSLIENQLSTKGINLKTSFYHLKKDTIFKRTKDTTLVDENFSVNSKSTYLKDNQAYKLYYSNPSYEALKRSFGGIFLSLILSLLIISCLFYLLKTINQQKELATIKNDLISNITHEFKTPIATVSTAIEAIENFNVLEDKEKTKKYLSMSSIQLKKLHQMVEKLLETATLDSEQLLLKKETIDVVEMTEKLVHKHQLLANKKTLNFSWNLQPIYLNVDVFHFENVISNLIDNAIKYGGNTIDININSILNSTEITIADDGNGIEKNQQEKIFDKFYRVPKGNTHDVKGFGIGLYYCKKIIEKHFGSIFLSSDKNQTIFKTTIPNV